MSGAARAIGVDFGTTNSAIAVAGSDGSSRLASFPLGAESVQTFRSLLYFFLDDEGAGPLRSVSGPEAIERYLAAEEKGRLMQSLKSFLASRHFSATSVFGRTHRLEGLIALILEALRQAAERDLAGLDGPVVVGRPVRFAGAESSRDEQFALRRLEAAFRNAGFGEVVFEYEPVAAAYHYEVGLDCDALILIGDFGGGTSDFSLLRVGPAARAAGRADAILGNDGVAIAGDAFDGKIVRHAVAPLLGQGTEYRSQFDRVLRVPTWIYGDLERWHHVSFLKSPRTMKVLVGLRQEALEPEKFAALVHLVRADLGFDLYRSVERAKLELSERDSTELRYENDPIRLVREIERAEFESWIADELAAIEACVDGLLERAGVAPGEIDRVFLTGGSSFVPAVRAIFERRFGAGRIRSGEELTSVASGLALRALERSD